jgi:hypothetical protein
MRRSAWSIAILVLEQVSAPGDEQLIDIMLSPMRKVMRNGVEVVVSGITKESES